MSMPCVRERCEQVEKQSMLKIKHEILLHMSPMRMIRNRVGFRGCFSKIVQPTSVQKEKEWVSGGQIKHELQTRNKSEYLSLTAG